MDFYSELSRHYDAVFAVDAAEMAFMAGLPSEGAAVLDLGCGTGNKTVYLSERAASVEAVDLDPGMIAKAKQDNARPNIHYAVLDMLDAGKAFAGRRFDAVFCLGNTLVHLPSPKAFQGLLTTVSDLTSDSGGFILQILNYDRIIDQDVTSLPVIETPDVRFYRAYARQVGLLRFVTALEIKAGGEMLHNDIPLYPLRKQELTDMLLRAGFRTPEYFGGYRGEAHQENSFVTIAHCRKA